MAATTSIGHMAERPTGLDLPELYYVYSTVNADVTGDGIADTIYAIGRAEGESTKNFRFDNFQIWMKNGADQTMVKHRFADWRREYNKPVLQVADFTGDGISELYVKAHPGGNAPIAYNYIISFVGNGAREIYGDDESASLSIECRLLDGFRAELINPVTNETMVVDISDRLGTARDKYYTADGKLREKKSIKSAWCIATNPVNTDADGIWRMKKTQVLRFGGLQKAVAFIHTCLKYDGSGWQATDIVIEVDDDD